MVRFSVGCLADALGTGKPQFESVWANSSSQLINNCIGDRTIICWSITGILSRQCNVLTQYRPVLYVNSARVRRNQSSIANWSPILKNRQCCRKARPLFKRFTSCESAMNLQRRWAILRLLAMVSNLLYEILEKNLRIIFWVKVQRKTSQIGCDFFCLSQTSNVDKLLINRMPKNDKSGSTNFVLRMIK